MVETLCNLVDGNQTFEGIYVSIYQNKDDKQMEVESFSKMLVPTYQNFNLQLHEINYFQYS
jgi:S-adenosylmethionine/arginine decarboxylase-like enzyme